MATATLLTNASPLLTSKPVSFTGDGDELLSALVSACQAKYTKPANPALFGRDLKPYDFGEAVTTTAKPARLLTSPVSGMPSVRPLPTEALTGAGRSRKTNRAKGAGGQPAAGAAASAGGAKAKPLADTGAKRSKVGRDAGAASNVSKAPPASGRKPANLHAAATTTAACTPPASTKPASSFFAGPGFCCSPQPEHLPLPPVALLRRAAP